MSKNPTVINAPQFQFKEHTALSVALCSRLHDSARRLLMLAGEYTKADAMAFNVTDDMFVFFGRPKDLYISSEEGIIMPMTTAEKLGFVRKVRKIKRPKSLTLKKKR